MKKLSLVLALIFFSVSLALAQRTVSGTVADEKGEPLYGASVLVTGTAVGTTTDFDGKYSLKVPTSANSIEISYTGFTTQVMELGASNIVDVTLAEGIQISDVIVTALGIKKDAKRLGYAVTQVDGDKITETRNNSAVDALAGVVPGLTINSNNQPGGSSQAVVRGYSSISGNNQALLVIDGVPVTNGFTGGSEGSNSSRSQDFGNQLNDLDPDNIESMSVLKGAAATALYGKSAANGAIIVTTKTGKKGETLSLDYSTSLTYSQVNRLPQLQNTYGQGWSGLWATDENGSWGPKADGKPRLWGNTVDNSRQLKPFTIQENNLRDFFELGRGSNHSVGISGGTENAAFRVNLSTANEDGIVPDDHDTYRRNVVGMNGSIGNDKITVGGTVEYTNKKASVISTGQGNDAGAGPTLFQEIIQIPRDHSILDMKDYKAKFYNYDNFYTPYAANPYYALSEQGNAFKDNKVRGNIYTNFKFNKNWTAAWKVGADFSNANTKDWGNAVIRTPGSPNSSANNVAGRVTQRTTGRSQVNSDVMLTYKNNNIMDKVGIEVSAGHNVNERRLNTFNTYITKLSIPGFYDLSNSTEKPTSNEYSSIRRSIGAFGILELSYDNWLYATVTGRNDWSSTLPTENNSFFYPSFSMSAVLSDLLDLKSAKISYWKVRAGIAKAGNDLGPYNIFAVYNSAGAAGGFGNTNFPIAGVNAFELSDRLENTTLTNELTTELEIGTDIQFFKRRVGLGFSYYDKISDGQIINVQTDPASGFTNQFVNLGQVQNKGIELNMNFVPVKGKHFEWSFNTIYSKNKNEVLTLPEDVEKLVLSTLYTIEIRAEKGKPLGALYAATAATNDAGQIIVDKKGIPQLADEKKYIGSADHDFALGFQNLLRYDDLSFSFNFDYRKGGKFYSYTKRLNYFVGNAWDTQFNDRRPFVVPNSVVDNGDGTYTENQRPVSHTDYWSYWGASKFQEEKQVLDRTFFKLRNVALTYKLPTRLAKKVSAKGASLTLFGRNLVIWTPSENHYVDPEIGTIGSGIISRLGEFAGIPTPASYGATLKLSL